MNKRNKKRVNKVLCVLLAVILSTGSLELPKVRAQQIAENETVAAEKVWETERCRITYRLNDCWEDGYTAMVTVENRSDTQIENWHVSFPLCQELTNLWNAQIIDNAPEVTIFKNLGWNQDIPAGESIHFGFTASGSFGGFPEICEISVVQQTVSEDDYEITCEVTDDWGTGYTGQLCILNRSDKTIEDWQLSFNLSREITDLWNGQIFSREKGRYLVKNTGNNQNIAPGETIQIGFVVNDGSAEEPPCDFLLEEFTLGNQTSTGGGDHSGGETDPGEEDDPNKPEETDGEIVLTIDTDSFDENETWEMYLTDQRVTHLSGALQGAQKVETLTYVITDLYENVIDSGEIDIQETWQAEDIGLVLGMNFITVTAVCGPDSQEDTQQQTIEAQISLMNFNKENMDAADVDLTDTDGDDLPNYFEAVYGTDPLAADTDTDGLTDLAEITQTGTDPLKADTDENGIRDDDEDPDGDGLTNLEELFAGTGVFYPDTDGDGLSDGEEVQQYHTDPLAADTDSDGLEDGEDARLGFDPLKPDTDENGILDGDEVICQTYTREIDTERKAGITQVSVSMECAGAIENQLLIQDVYELDTRSTDVVGLVGVPVQIETETEFDTAVITFTYDETALGETSEENLRIMWYDEKQDEYILLDEETVLDVEHNTLSCETDHFSTWLVVDREVWWLALKVDMGYGSAQENVQGNADAWQDNSYYLTTAWILNREDYEDGEANWLDYLEGQYLTVIMKAMRRWPSSTDPSAGGYLHGGGFFGNDTMSCAFQKYFERLNELEPVSAERRIYFFSITDIDYDETIVHKAMEENIAIYCVTGIHCENQNMRRMAARTGGRYLTLTSWREDEVITFIEKDISQYLYDLRDNIVPDSDGDGLPDIIEQNGIRLSNGQIIYTDPYKYDTDGDGISDYDEVGGLPREETYTADGEEFTAMVSRGGAYNRLSEDFIYVDGRVNENGVINSEKMGYVSYSDHFKREKYENIVTPRIFDRSQKAEGDARIHGLYRYLYDDANFAQKTWYRYFYYQVNNMVYDTMLLSSYDPNLEICFYRYLQGQGGRYKGCVEDGTREYLLANYMLIDALLPYDSINSCFEENMQRAKTVAESVLNEYNTEIYVSLSPKTTWSGCQYVDYTKNQWASSAVAIASNISAFGIFNSADASVTLHCTYNPDTKQYTMEFIYYIVDFYDYAFYQYIVEQDALGLARSYELFGYCPGTMVWETGKKPIVVLEGYK